jgi:hypothetical protein
MEQITQLLQIITVQNYVIIGLLLISVVYRRIKK